MLCQLRCCLCAAILYLSSLGAAANEAPTYRFSPVNQYDINLTAAYWNPIINYVADKSGVHLALKIGRTSADTTSYVLAQEVEFAFTNHLFAPEREKLGWKVFGRRNLAPVSGQIVVPADSAITSLAQLKGKDIAFPGPEALIAYKVPMAHLIEQKIDINVIFGGNQNGALGQLAAGKVQAVGGNSQLIDSYAQRENKKFRVLWSSTPYHDLALMASGKVKPADLKAVAKAFFEMKDDPQGREILRQAAQKISLPGDIFFIASDGSEYVNYRKFYQSAPLSLR
ncbi:MULTISPECIES: phosphate/phosphite/phosphonate ABC transporter substrate-binding protein [unclassified Undibacterium]|uniref:phosphate/phosphite/phosphonate ABC transporter substrate-binding protein n=1 Tax=unclassified Undibacterium TaxID=2630295 RepID=UPI002AC8A2FE|nr:MULTISPECIES: phosphate/phosphite/phosphonate ABC transporter substrate-binding protein [unclassified Undibacterium]MEB0140677.1 phosphate/phosphite/phosphonate ABC transporter substrate-binding protein [Undibacterium sp. CCC2.1]MEB0173707.1 phosphate/phosphite/phosphonate ABC transporter substrate-binding protein [Undibacterium sp. CCC1.1]MEB0177661.1 phosphate/phosphite/phosphonate ABC transporter substrate-binding protein [Undibacterium sp. CCC3.4]MEB0216874.1 phosphate/phosphite/phosphon